MKKPAQVIHPIRSQRNSIPPPISKRDTIPKPSLTGSNHMVFSFELLDFHHPLYNCNGMCDKGIMNCFEKLQAYSACTVNELFARKGGTIRLHPIRKDDVDEWPPFFLNNSHLEDVFYQIAFGTSKGRAHGILIENIFYIIWLDPHHFLYHDKRYGPKKGFTPLCKCQYKNVHF